MIFDGIPEGKLSSYHNSSWAIKFHSTFDESDFRSYIELFLEPHQWEAGWWFTIACGLTSAIFLVVMRLTWGDLNPYVVLLSILSLISIYYFILGLRMITKHRLPRWGSKRWNAKTYIAYARMHRCDTENPVCYHAPYGEATNDDWPPFFFNYSLIYLPFGNSYIFCDSFSEPLAFNLVPGLLPRYKKIPTSTILNVEFSGLFTSSKIYKGNRNRVFAESYADVHDVIEDVKRYPGLAIIRHKNAYSQLIVFTDKLEGGSWDEIKCRILQDSPNALPRKERKRLLNR